MTLSSNSDGSVFRGPARLASVSLGGRNEAQGAVAEGWVARQSGWLSRVAPRSVALVGAAALGLVACGVGWLVGREAVDALARVDGWLWLGFALVIVLIAGGAALGHPAPQLVALLLGVPRELPFWPLGDEDRAIAAKARWLCGFLARKPRGYNTAGSQLACGAIAVKVLLKRYAIERERRCPTLSSLKRRRREGVELRKELAAQVSRLLAEGGPAAELSRREHEAGRAVDALDAEIAAQRLRIQDVLVGKFVRAWDEQRPRVPGELHARVAAQFEQPEGEPPALLPAGLVRSPLVYGFEYGLFFGRVVLAALFVATFEPAYLVWAVLILVLDLYVIEPVILKLQISALGLVLDSPGHKLVDLKRYLAEHVPPGEVFRVPITVPKFSSNPAWTNLEALIRAAARRSGQRITRVVPLAMRLGIRDSFVHLERGRDGRFETESFRAALEAELAANAAKFPLRAELRAERNVVVVSLVDDARAIWDFIGEDASQAFVYLRRNLLALKDTLSHLGRRFQPVFILASNTKDQDAIHYEVEQLADLQEYSDEHYGGQVGFLYLLHGGEWYNFNSELREFDAKDKDFAKAVPNYRKQLVDRTLGPRERVVSALLERLDASQFAAAFNELLEEQEFYQSFDEFDFEGLPPHLRPRPETLALLERRRRGEPLRGEEHRELNRELLLTVAPMRVSGDFFKKVGNDIPVQELLVSGKTKPSVYVERRTSEHVQDPNPPNYVRVWGDFARYTGLRGTNQAIQQAILAGRELTVESVPEIGAVIDDKNEFGPGEIEKGVATLLHPDNRHIVIGVPRINVTLPEFRGQTIASDYIVSAQAARENHNTADGQSRARLFDFSSPAYGKWFKRPRPYLAHYAHEVLNAAHALSHDFQQSYLVAGASGRLAGFTEALYGPNRFQVQASAERAPRARAVKTAARVLMGTLALVALGLVVR